MWATPQQPLRAVKDAVQSMIDVISEQDSLDHISLEIFASTSKHEVNLTGNLQDVADLLYQRQSGHYDRATNIAGGLIRAISELTSSRARGNAHKVIMLMSDGVANTDENGNWLGDGSAAAKQYALNRAQEAADLGIKIHTISVGYNVDRALMQEIAAIGKGQEFYAVGSPSEYSEQLEEIFRALGGKRPVALIE
ncbi:MAG: VWA domain-containing protein [Planctomycetota bacterium]|nr:MAG: VWA domain-containing protein [Planctomycetota bacterium]